MSTNEEFTYLLDNLIDSQVKAVDTLVGLFALHPELLFPAPHDGENRSLDVIRQFLETLSHEHGGRR